MFQRTLLTMILLAITSICFAQTSFVVKDAEGSELGILLHFGSPTVQIWTQGQIIYADTVNGAASGSSIMGLKFGF